MIDIIVMSFIPLYKVIGPFLSFDSLLLMVWGGQDVGEKVGRMLNADQEQNGGGTR
jgi:hypothetical protein